MYSLMNGKARVVILKQEFLGLEFCSDSNLN